ncbi:hypothetical protein RE9431_49710 (plasmid) [Prescottella equi]|uniref:hypothetical protein n=1 Tax=Rhodococcus hoagii TaxID=43767 RepID=UPI001C7844DA|nr:hypothetical protein [Prescottella equi]BCN66516.1 hypothetical protein RE9431_49710 [Prescottella equi]
MQQGRIEWKGPVVVVTRKVFRQKMLQAAILAKIDREHLRIDTDRVRESLQTVRRNVSRDRLMLSYLVWWERIVDGNDIEELRAVVARDDETGNDMRNLSPLYVLFTEDERRQFLEAFWAQWSLQ